MVFLILLFSHYIGDYVFQKEFLCITKGVSWYNLLVHCILYTGTVTAAFYLLGYTDLYFIIAVLLFTHIVIDKAKCEIGEYVKKNTIVDKGYGAYNGSILYIDQLLHILTIVYIMLYI